MARWGEIAQGREGRGNIVRTAVFSGTQRQGLHAVLHRFVVSEDGAVALRPLEVDVGVLVAAEVGVGEEALVAQLAVERPLP